MSAARGSIEMISSYAAPGSPDSGPCTVCASGVGPREPSARPSIPVWSEITSNSPARRRHETVWRSSQNVWPIHSLGATG
jgi:hypothetical protein